MCKFTFRTCFVTLDPSTRRETAIESLSVRRYIQCFMLQWTFLSNHLLPASLIGVIYMFMVFNMHWIWSLRSTHILAEVGKPGSEYPKKATSDVTNTQIYINFTILHHHHQMCCVVDKSWRNFKYSTRWSLCYKVGYSWIGLVVADCFLTF